MVKVFILDIKYLGLFLAIPWLYFFLACITESHKFQFIFGLVDQRKSLGGNSAVVVS